MAVSQKNMGRTRVEAQERLDLPDFESLQDLVDDSVQQQIGALVGPGGGCLSPFSFSTSAAGGIKYLEPAPFQFYWSQKAAAWSVDGTTRAWRGGVTTFDPGREGQQPKIDCTAVVGQATFLYARPKTVDTATDGRRKFVGGAAVSASVKTRKQLVVEFKFSATTPDNSNNDGWAPIIYISQWVGDVPVPSQISVWDSWAAYAQAKQPGNFWDAAQQSTTDGSALYALDVGADLALSGWNDMTGAANPQRSFGLGAMVTQLRARLRRHLDKAGSQAWFRDPVRDLKQLDTSLAAAESAVVSLVARPYLGAAGFVSYNGLAQANSYALGQSPPLSLGWASAQPFGAITFTRVSAGVLSFAATMPNINAQMLQVEVQPYDPINTANVYTVGGLFRIFITDSQGNGTDCSFFVKVWCR